MKTIVISTDFSPAATNAMHYGIDMAKAINASVTLFHGYHVPISLSDTPIIFVSVEELRKEAEEKMSKLKKDVEHITSGSIKVYAETRLGDVLDELEVLCSKINPFAVVMGSKGMTGLDKILFGSTTLTAIKHLTWPVICVPPGKTFGAGIKKIGFACDFKAVMETTPAHYIMTFTKEFNASLHVLNVDSDNKHFTPETPAQSYLLHTLLKDANPSYHFIEHKNIEDGINEFATTNNLDLVITIPKKHKLLEGLFKKSSTRQLIVESHVPVMCVHE
jgi:nucleotide-binding universal stress UspA family protein